ncbi:hypothetical protein B0H13DRAFT_191471 [Mycena leptocephala]|nr:hypothetical protein B0H13DRAFT_191471 [Mycena leptocephala]
MYCGSLQLHSDYHYDQHRPGMVQILPMPLNETSSPAISHCQSESQDNPGPGPRLSIGCGTLVHSGENVIRTGDTWSALHEAVKGVVVHLEEMYFGTEAKARRARALPTNRPCGCAEEGIGCAVCGNALGARYKLCSTHAARFPNFFYFNFFDNAVYILHPLPEWSVTSTVHCGSSNFPSQPGPDQVPSTRCYSKCGAMILRISVPKICPSMIFTTRSSALMIVTPQHG